MAGETDSSEATVRPKERRHEKVIPKSTTDELVRKGLLRSRVQGPKRLLDIVEQIGEKSSDEIFDQLSDDPSSSEGEEPPVEK